MPRFGGAFFMPRKKIDRPIRTKPTTPEEKQAAFELYRNQKAKGLPLPHFFADDGSRFYVDVNGKGDLYFRNSGKKQSTNDFRRAQEIEKTIKVEEREAWYKRNFERIPDGMTARQAAEADQAAEAADLGAARSDIQRQKKVYEHGAPLAGPEAYAGGFETVYNIDAADEKPNLEKSDKIATTQTLREQGMPTSRAEAIRKRAVGTPAPAMDGQRFQAVYEDIQANNRPKAGYFDQLVDRRAQTLINADQAAGVPASTTVSTLKRAGMLSASILGAGVVTLPLSAQAAESSRAVAEKNPTLKNKLTAFADEVSMRGDQLDALGTGVAATGVGAIPGAVMMGIGGGISNVGSAASLLIDAPDAIRRSQQKVKDREINRGYDPTNGDKNKPGDFVSKEAVALNEFLKDPVKSVQQAIPEGLRIASEYFDPLRKSIGFIGGR